MRATAASRLRIHSGQTVGMARWSSGSEDIGTSVMQLKAILMAERLKRERQLGLSDFVKALREGR